MKKLSTEILAINKKTEDISEFILGISEEVDFQHGQFLTIDIPHEKVIERNGKKIIKNIFVKRAYSIVDIKDGKIVLWIKNINGIGTSYLFSRNIGDKLNIKTSFGNFFVKGEEENLVFMATGIGIPPIVSHLKNIFENQKEGFKNKKIQLIYGIRKKEDFFIEKILKDFSEENTSVPGTGENFSYKIFFSREDEKISEECEEFEKGYFTQIFDKKDFKSENTEFYFCGSLPLMKEIGERLEGFGVEKDRFIFEAY